MINRILVFFLSVIGLHGFGQSPANMGKVPVSVIFDTDIAGDYDDVGAMALLHAFADKGEAKILATISCNAFETTVPTISVLNTYFGRPGLPVGVTRRNQPNKDCPQQWAQAIIEKYPHQHTANNDAREAVSLYRELLAVQPDQSVTIVTVGFFTNLAGLIASSPDNYSKLTGKELVQKKVRVLVSMAARLPEGKSKGREYNVYVDTRAADTVFKEWNTPVILSPFEVGEKIYTGIPLIRDSTITNSPVKDAYRVALQKDKNDTGRMSWDQTAVLAAVRGIEPYFSTRRINLKIEPDGSNTLIPGGKFIYLGFKMKPEEIQAIIEQLMQHQPKKV